MTDHNLPYDPAGHEPMPEGEEKAPPLTHTMGIVRWIILGGVTLFALIMILSYLGATPWSTEGGDATQYHCPMHPTYVSSQPGECPICGMSLVPMKNAADTVATSGAETMSGATATAVMAKPGQYACPMDPEVVSDVPGKCPKCGMDLVQIPDSLKQGPAKAGQYYCPMHTYVVSDKPGKCPICDMDMVQATADQAPPGQTMRDMPGIQTPTEPPKPKAPDAGTAGMDMGEAPVPGLVPVTIEPQRLQLIGVRSGTVQRRALSDETQLLGYVTPDESRVSNLNVRVSGWVQKLFVNQTGQKVSAGQELLTVYSQDLYQAQQDFLTAAQSVARPATDSMLAATRRQILDAARDRLRLLGVPEEEITRLETTGQARAELPLTSPVTGIVLKKTVLPGQFVGPDQPLFTVADLSRVWVLADVYESDLAGITTGRRAVMTLAAFPGLEFSGTVSFIYPTVSPETRTLKVRLEFANPEMKIRPGMYAEVRLQSAQESILAIPRDAVMDDGHMAYAFVIHDGTHFEPRLITIGRTSGEYAEVLAGLTEGEVVVTSANFLIDSESRLQAAIAGMGGTAKGAHAGHGK